MKVEGLSNQVILCLLHSFFKIFIYVFIYSAVLCLSCSMWELVPQSGIEHGSLNWCLGPWTTWGVSPHTLGDCNRSQTSSEAPLRAEAWGGCSNSPVARMWFIGHDSLTLSANIGLLPCVCPLVCDEIYH